MKLVVTNAFSLNMVSGGFDRDLLIQINQVDETWFKEYSHLYEIHSAVGHADTARVFSNVLGTEIPMNRINITLGKDADILLVGQYVGPRLPEGATTLPSGASIKWFLVSIYHAY